MSTIQPGSAARFRGHPLYALFAPVPIVCFSATLITDIVYWRTAAMQWANFSAWLLVVGIIFAVLAVTAGLIDFFGDRRIGVLRAAWVHAVGNGIALVLSVFNAFIHSRDAYTSVVPSGLILSATVVAIVLFTGWSGWSMVYRRVGMYQPEST